MGSYKGRFFQMGRENEDLRNTPEVFLIYIYNETFSQRGFAPTGAERLSCLYNVSYLPMVQLRLARLRSFSSRITFLQTDMVGGYLNILVFLDIFECLLKRE